MYAPLRKGVVPAPLQAPAPGIPAPLSPALLSPVPLYGLTTASLYPYTHAQEESSLVLQWPRGILTCREDYSLHERSLQQPNKILNSPEESSLAQRNPHKPQGTMHPGILFPCIPVPIHTCTSASLYFLGVCFFSSIYAHDFCASACLYLFLTLYLCAPRSLDPCAVVRSSPASPMQHPPVPLHPHYPLYPCSYEPAALHRCTLHTHPQRLRKRSQSTLCLPTCFHGARHPDMCTLSAPCPPQAAKGPYTFPHTPTALFASPCAPTHSTTPDQFNTLGCVLYRLVVFPRGLGDPNQTQPFPTIWTQRQLPIQLLERSARGRHVAPSSTP